MCKPRQIKLGQKIHESVFQKMDNKKSPQPYSPKARLYNGLNWTQMSKKEKRELMEEDPYTNAERLIAELEKFDKIPDDRIGVLMNFLATGKC